MTIGIPVEIDMNSITSKVHDGTEAFSKFIKQDFPLNKTIQQGNDIYINTGDDVVVADYNVAEHNNYIDGTILFGAPYGGAINTLVKVVATTGEAPKYPNEYAVLPETSSNYNIWRYNSKYLHLGSTPPTGVITIILNDVKWIYSDLYNGFVNIKIYKGSTLYINNDIPHVISVVKGFKDIPSELLSTSTPNIFDFYVPKMILSNALGWYTRTHLNVPTEFRAVNAVELYPVNYVNQINGFTKIQKINKMRPFDGKNYTKATAYGSMQYNLKTLSSFNSIVMGNVKAQSVIISIKNSEGNVVEVLDRENISSSGLLDSSGILESSSSTEIFYIQGFSESLYDENYEVEVRLLGTKIELGYLMLSKAVDAGFTNLSLKTSYKDFSTFEYDVFGNADYVDRARISTYNATVDIPIENYDMIDRLMTSIGKNIVVIDGSDKFDDTVENVFSSTQKIGRVLSYSQNNKVSNNEIEKIATYSMTIEELV